MELPNENKMQTHEYGMTKSKALHLARAIHPEAHVQFNPNRFPKAPCRVGYFSKGGRYVDRAGGMSWPEALEKARPRMPKGGRL